jgi:hypothetical protein
MNLARCKLLALLPLCLAFATPLLGQGGSGSQHYFLGGAAILHMDHAVSNLWVNLSSLTGTPGTITISSPLTGFGDGVGEHVFYQGPSQHVYQLYYCDQNCVPLNTWTYQDMTTMAGNAPLPVVGGALSSFVSGTQEHVLYFGANEHVYQLVTKTGGGWTYSDLTVLASGTLAASGSPLGSFNDSLGQHVFYIGTNGHIYQLYYAYSSKTWVAQDLTASTGAPPAASSSRLAAFDDLQSQAHVFYMGANAHIYQLYTHPGAWSYQDMSSVMGGSAAVGSSLSAFTDSSDRYYGPGGAHVVYFAPCAPDPAGVTWCPVHQLLYNGSTWVDQRLASTFGAEPGSSLATLPGRDPAANGSVDFEEVIFVEAADTGSGDVADLMFVPTDQPPWLYQNIGPGQVNPQIGMLTFIRP